MPWVFPIFESIFLPPGVLLLAILVSLLLFALRRRTAAFAVGIVGCVGLYLLAITPFADLLITPLENAYPPLQGAAGATGFDGAKYVVVLGGGLVPASPAEHGKPSLGPESLKRLVYGVRIASSTGLPLIVSGGTVPSEPTSEPEALVAEQTIRSLGLGKLTILVEGRSRNTWENAALVEKRFHPDRVILVTSAYHMPRSVVAFERNGISVIPAPTDYLSDRARYTVYSYLPTAGALRISAIALKEYLGYIYYRLFLFHGHT